MQCRFKLALTVLFMLSAGLVTGRLRSKTVRDPLSGIWTGDWGTTPSHRNPVTVKLEWDGTMLGGTVNPGPSAVQFTKASFDRSRGSLHLELELRSSGREIDYFVDGMIEGNKIIGTWHNDDNKGNFRLIKK